MSAMPLTEVTDPDVKHEVLIAYAAVKPRRTIGAWAG
jgi:hypothetical protein